MENPWNSIDLEIYEKHMEADTLQQLPALNELMKKQLERHVDSVMILGVAGGNGLEYIKEDTCNTVYGVDINAKYLHECRKRYANLSDKLQLLCIDLTQDDVRLCHVDLLVANLIIEYIGERCFQNIVRQCEPMTVSCVVQINTDISFVSTTPYQHDFDKLEEVHHQIGEHTLNRTMSDVGYKQAVREVVHLPNGKCLIRLDYQKIR